MDTQRTSGGIGRSLLFHLPLVVVTALILCFAIVPSPEPQVMPDQDKFDHILAFFAFAVTLRFARPRLRLGWVMMLAVAYGAGIEVMQTYIPGRDVSGWDVLADGIGGALGCLVPARIWAWLRHGPS